MAAPQVFELELLVVLSIDQACTERIMASPVEKKMRYVSEIEEAKALIAEGKIII